MGGRFAGPSVYLKEPRRHATTTAGRPPQSTTIGTHAHIQVRSAGNMASPIAAMMPPNIGSTEGVGRFLTMDSQKIHPFTTIANEPANNNTTENMSWPQYMLAALPNVQRGITDRRSAACGDLARTRGTPGLLAILPRAYRSQASASSRQRLAGRQATCESAARHTADEQEFGVHAGSRVCLPNERDYGRARTSAARVPCSRCTRCQTCPRGTLPRVGSRSARSRSR
jgi:hypothetical protein